jgi:hypothetical protein
MVGQVLVCVHKSRNLQQKRLSAEGTAKIPAAPQGVYGHK